MILKIKLNGWFLTSSPLLHLQGSFGGSPDSLFLLLLLSTPVKIFYDYTDEHVEYEKSDEQDEGYEVE